MSKPKFGNGIMFEGTRDNSSGHGNFLRLHLFPVNICLFSFNNEKTRTVCEICSMVSTLLILNRFNTLY